MDLDKTNNKRHGFANIVTTAMQQNKSRLKKMSNGNDTKKLSGPGDQQNPGRRASLINRFNSSRDETEIVFPTGARQKRHTYNNHRMGSLDEDEPELEESIRSSNSLVSGSRRTPPPVKVRARQLDRQPSFTNKEPLYMVDLAGDQLICRKRASSLTNQDEMTENERRLFQFMQERLGDRYNHHSSGPFRNRRQASRVYTNESLIVDPRMSSFTFDGLFEKNPDGTFVNRFKSDTKRYLTPMVLPPIHSCKPTPLKARDFSKPLPQQRPLTRAEWVDFKHIRYLRPKAKRFQSSSEMDYPYMWK